MAQLAPLKIDLTTGVVAQMGSSDTVKVGNLGTGTPDATTLLRGDGAWVSPSTARSTLGLGALALVAALTGPITSDGAGLTAVASQTGTGSTFVMSAGPTITGSLLVTGVAAGNIFEVASSSGADAGLIIQPGDTASAVNLQGSNAAHNAAKDITINIDGGNVGVGMVPVRTLDVTGTFGVTGAVTFGSTLSVGAVNGTTVPNTKTLVVTTDTLAVLAATTSAQLRGVINDETGGGALVFADTPTLITPVLGVATGTSLTLAGAAGGNILLVKSSSGNDAAVILQPGKTASSANIQGSNNALNAAKDITINVDGGNVGVGMVPVRTLDVTGTFGATGAATLGSTLYVTGVLTAVGAVECASTLSTQDLATFPLIRIPSGSDPSAPTDGMIWYTGSLLKIRVSSTTKTLAFV